MIVLQCENSSCLSEDLETYDAKIAETGEDWFHCKECGSNFHILSAQYNN